LIVEAQNEAFENQGRLIRAAIRGDLVGDDIDVDMLVESLERDAAVSA
jgi:hypothetical protein